MSRFTDARAAFEAAETALDKATDALHAALCDASNRLRPYASSVFEEYCFHEHGMMIKYGDTHDGSHVYIEMTHADLQADDPAQAYLDRKEAEKEDQRRNSLAEVARRNRDALVATLKAMDPAERDALLAQVGDKA